MLDSRHDEKDAVKVLDFGIAKLRDVVGPRLTGKGMVCGTPGYSSPEQARGEELDGRSDLYSVGVLLYELLSGKLPFEASSPGAAVAKMLVEAPVPLHVRRPDIRVPPALEAVVMKALSTEREARHASAEDLRRALVACGTTGERPAPLAAAQGTVTFEASPPAAAPRTSSGRTPAPKPTATARATSGSRTISGSSRTPSGARAATPRPVQGRREVAGAVAVIVGSALVALLIGGGVWVGLSWFRQPGDAAGTVGRAGEASVSPSSSAEAASPSAPGAGPAASRDAVAVALPGRTLAAGTMGIVVVGGTPGAQITIDGRPAGVTPRELRLPPGSHAIRASRPDLGSTEGTIEVEAGQRMLWTATLTK
jgi:hypothetical protein